MSSEWLHTCYCEEDNGKRLTFLIDRMYNMGYREDFGQIHEYSKSNQGKQGYSGKKKM